MRKPWLSARFGDKPGVSGRARRWLSLLGEAGRGGGRRRTHGPSSTTHHDVGRRQWSDRGSLRVGTDHHGVRDRNDLVHGEVRAGGVFPVSPPGLSPGRCTPSRLTRRPPGGRRSGSSGCRQASALRQPPWTARPLLEAPPQSASPCGEELRRCSLGPPSPLHQHGHGEPTPTSLRDQGGSPRADVSGRRWTRRCRAARRPLHELWGKRGPRRHFPFTRQHRRSRSGVDMSAQAIEQRRRGTVQWPACRSFRSQVGRQPGPWSVETSCGARLICRVSCRPCRRRPRRRRARSWR